MDKSEAMREIEENFDSVTVCFGSKDHRLFVQGREIPVEKINEKLKSSQWEFVELSKGGEEADTEVTLNPEKSQAIYSKR